MENLKREIKKMIDEEKEATPGNKWESGFNAGRLKGLIEVLSIIEETQKHNIYIKWCIQDIEEAAKEMNIIVTDDEAREILSDIEHNHDCNIGVSWDTIQTNIDNFTYNNFVNCDKCGFQHNRDYIHFIQEENKYYCDTCLDKKEAVNV